MGNPREILNKWFEDEGGTTHRVLYDLDADSIVFDVGGYNGDFAAKIYNKYESTVHIFEPVRPFHKKIEDRFSENDKIIPHMFGLSDRNAEDTIFLNKDASSMFVGEVPITIQLRGLADVINENDIDFIDLIKINIEGGEFDLLDDIITKGLQTKLGNIQVQFHRFIPNCVERRDKIREVLQKTHKLTYDYPFVWENWQLK